MKLGTVRDHDQLFGLIHDMSFNPSSLMLVEVNLHISKAVSSHDRKIDMYMIDDFNGKGSIGA